MPVVGVAIAVAAIVLVPSWPGSTQSTFVDRALGAASPSASLERRLSTGDTLSVDTRGIDAHVGAAKFALALRGEGQGEWKRYRDGAARATRFGRESVLSDQTA